MAVAWNSCHWTHNRLDGVLLEAISQKTDAELLQPDFERHIVEEKTIDATRVFADSSIRFNKKQMALNHETGGCLRG
ncbi:MAG: hypothetical protein LBK73_00735 [Treponema sp.]|jgi:hypothetical protein|nr:hypothetical protein [Treponema sp.]